MFPITIVLIETLENKPIDGGKGYVNSYAAFTPKGLFECRKWQVTRGTPMSTKVTRGACQVAFTQFTKWSHRRMTMLLLS